MKVKPKKSDRERIIIFAPSLKRLMKHRGYSSYRIAKESNYVCNTMLHNYTKGNSEPMLENIEELSIRLGYARLATFIEEMNIVSDQIRKERENPSVGNLKKEENHDQVLQTEDESSGGGGEVAGSEEA